MAESGMTIILLQALYYGIVMFLSIFLVAAFLRGFLGTYFKVRTSFGKYVMVKIRTPLRDYFAKGWIDEDFLVYNHKDGEKRLSLDPKDKVLYRCLNVNWIDVDEGLNSIGKSNYEHVTGFDAIKFSDLLKRALMRPTVGDNKEKLIIGLLIICILFLGVNLYLNYIGSGQLTNLLNTAPAVISTVKGSVIESASI